MWQLLKAQFIADFGPFLILIPKPLQEFIVKRFHETTTSIQHITLGVVSSNTAPMSMVLLFLSKTMFTIGHFLNSIGEKFAFLADKVERLNDKVVLDNATHPL